ncbi:MAG TPA: 16S rRNA (uracil(1498)-N(3))-methyltransferase [Gammaproteobacteria bacterium]|jgi:16S rRNA (uracil1498-N3)-methyltransferase|nr:16S rRNA (uracil(1498)-N(3))-methyltransferase [Gammaproteobacteria bacterium]HIL64459.1 16S rRNA (uracil(1498)-N(3))-methyltransferase [Porticoccaceae bacterium]HAT26886.1 16S rRNA (uracil(1498)-N(3))-methyltransferase [Gammaproteobacteria bacterium]HIA58378.1 16S rRNA (uracil(1498)-N(3))-methyltransferase [Gammaproteobacteria bacterium]HIF85538.1 16S rRNA (uracil(1498)-N(3))-methyltransferase [Gammaproteobacteria bacterium]|tara:strand:+ start:1339 stop:2073 length:735 start_codon:yes stop_codon:yes gene_type:complete
MMRIPRVYTNAQLEADSLLSLSAEVSHYLCHVLRLVVAGAVHLFNGRDGEFAGEIIQIRKHEVSVRLLRQIRSPGKSALVINLGLGLSRGDRMDFAIQKSTELGVTRLTPLYTEHGEVRLHPARLENKLRHWRKIAISASEQSGRIDIPEVCMPASMADWRENNGAGLNLLLEPGGQEQFPERIGKSASINLLIGPEAGFSEAEINWGRQRNFAIVGMGARILRTETAPIAALSILQYLYGDMR